MLTWLWQGLVLTLAVSAAFRLLPYVNAATRYWIWCCTLAVTTSLAWWPFAMTGLKSCTTGFTGATGGTGLQPCSSIATRTSYMVVLPSASDTLIAIALVVWGAVALLGFLRVLAGVGAVCALRQRCRPCPADLESRLPLWLEAQRRGRRARLMICDAVTGPTMLGFGPARIALPSSFLEALTPAELDQIVLHEHAHVQRWDDWTKLAQTLIQSALWIHPAIALAGRRMNLEREVACDEWVVARTAQPTAYARCLIRAAETRRRMADPMLGSALFVNARDLVRRIERLLTVNRRPHPNVSARVATTGACALVAIALQLRALPLVAEVGDVVLPTFAASPFRLGGPIVPIAPNAPSFVLAGPHPRSLALGDFTPRAGRRRFASVASASAPEGATADRPIAPVASAFAADAATADRPNAPAAPIAPVLEVRTFDGQYRAASAGSPAEIPRPWRAAEAAGIKIAHSFTRAGVSLARRF